LTAKRPRPYLAGVLRKILIANRGEIACRIIRTCKRLGVGTVAVYSEADAGAPHVSQADESVLLGPPPVKDSYLLIDKVVAAARACGADGIHPGYGLLSENAQFARAVASAGLTFVGPPPAVLDGFGDKIKARSVARAAGVSPTPGTDGPVAPDDEEALLRAAEEVGYPLLVKAASGGGGIGMQYVEVPGKLLRAASACADRGQAAFGDSRVYLEHFVRSPKHIEVQILCDASGGAVALGERECSLQRRHQKIIEETPSAAPFFDGPEGAARREKLLGDALAVARHVSYVGAGTVEFVASGDGDIYFLEVNARLQVEHCVTEMVTGIDLVEQQLRVASGESLSPSVLETKPSGHSIQARLYAEDPMKRFAPQPGHLETLRFPEQDEDLRIETGIHEGMDVTPFYDPMIAKVVAHGEDRKAAIARLDAALENTAVRLVGPAGPANTNLAFLRQLLHSDDFIRGSYDTSTAETLAKTLRKAKS